MDTRRHTHTRWGSSSVSIMQHWIFHVVRLNPSAPVNATVALELMGHLCRRSLWIALDHIVFCHPILRTVFRQLDGVPISVVGPADRGFSLLEQDVRDEDEVASLLQEETHICLDVANGPLIRARLLEVRTNHHFLFISAHPIICDRASLALIMSELRDRYPVFSWNKLDPRRPPVEYADFARRQFETLSLSELQKQLSYWKRQLLGARDLVQLPTDRPRPAMMMYSTQKHRFELTEELTSNLKRLAVDRSVSLLTVLLGGWGVLLGRWSAQQDLTIGALVSDRPLGCEGCLIGPFENILPIRVTVPPTATVLVLLSQIEAALCVAAANRDVPFHAIEESIRPLRDCRPIIQTALSLDQTSLEAAAGAAFPFGEIEVGKVWEARCGSTLELSVSVSPVEGQLVAVCEYAQELFDRSTIERVCRWWISLLCAMVNTPTSPVGRLTMLTAPERQCVISEFNHGGVAPLASQRIDAAFEDHVELTPDAPAAVEGLSVLSFLELNHRTNQLARTLRRRGMRAGEFVAIPSSPSLDSVVAAIAVLKAGGAYIAGAPAELRRGAVQAWAKRCPRTFIVSSRSEMGARRGDELIIALDADMDEISSESVENLQRDGATACDPACAVMGVDLRGQRRWIVIEHKNVTSTLASLDERLHFTSFDVWSMTHSLTSRVSLIELWGGLLYGSQVIIAPADAMKGAGSLSRFVARSGVTVLNQKPSEFLQCVDTSELTQQDHLQTVILSGEPLRAAALKPWFDVGRRWPRIIYLYGHRGLAVASAWSVVKQTDALRRSRSMVGGEPLSCCRLYILDRYRQPAPIGVVGDVYVAGEGVAQGYLTSRKRSEWTPDPLAVDEHSKVWKTGDRGYWTTEGGIELVFYSTSDTAIEAVRIESELLAHPGVRNASVAIRRNETGGDSYVAYVEGLREVPSPTQLRAYLELNVPAYMVPREFVCRILREMSA